ncbi:hypothetical protein SAMN05192569_1003157 [Parageobacillus thermantarcticus]|uniref:Uncharacterized protein n=1 Tax=Parageobacillus thermantarcticus TaxID=186116 RepID=A0A1I0SQZ3_9BACL|nr:hypothetical protein SAMN05192569_1003157 [Parageobacillus thermantarcticus]
MEDSRYILLSFLLNEYVRIVEGGSPFYFIVWQRQEKHEIKSVFTMMVHLAPSG